jgi:hypothetical protein
MCPACIATAASLVAGAVTTGGLAALAAFQLGARHTRGPGAFDRSRVGESPADAITQLPGDDHGTAENRIAR